jgi:Fe-S cluster assembly protein SufD
METAIEEVGTVVADTPVFRAPPDRRADEPPAWFAERQRSAWEEFQSLPMPQRKAEEWRFADLKKLAFDNFVWGERLAGRNATAAVARSQGLPQVAAKLVLGNNDLLQKSGTDNDGVVVRPLGEALYSHGDIIERYFMAQPATLGGAKFYALHLASLRGGVFVYVPPGIEIEHPIEIHQWLGGVNASAYPHTLVVADRGARVTVIDYFQSLTSEPGFACGVTDLAASDGASIDYICCQRWSRKVKGIHFSSTTTGRDAAVKSSFIHLGGAWMRTESLCTAGGAGSRSEMLSLGIAEGQQEMDCRTRQIHREPHSTSNLLYKNVLFDTARTIFAGLIKVEPGAHYTDAYQTCRNLLLSDEAEANSLPGLEINADQVKCSHGSTSGPLQPEEIHYLRTRGIHENVARQLLAFGFCREVIDRLGHSQIEAAITAMVEEKFRRMRRK